MHCRHRNKEIVSVSVKVLNNYASKSKIMTNESKIHIDQIQGRGIAGEDISLKMPKAKERKIVGEVGGV